MFLHLWKDVPIVQMTEDPVALGKGMTVYTGFLSQVGILLWAGAASVCFFCGKVLRPSIVDHKLRRFLLISGVLTLYLALDDMFLLHEIVLPHFGIPQELVMGGYVLVVLAYLFVFHRTILSTNFRLLSFSLFFFATAVILDVFKPFELYLNLIEESAELVGLVSWMVYFTSVGERAIDPDTKEQNVLEYPIEVS